MNTKRASPNSDTINRLLILASSIAPTYLLANWADVPTWLSAASAILLLAMLLAIIAITTFQYVKNSHVKTRVYYIARSWSTLLAICLAILICLVLPANSTVPEGAISFSGTLRSLDRHNGHVRMKVVESGILTAIRVQHHFADAIAQIEPGSYISGLWDGNYLISVKSKHHVYLSPANYLEARKKLGKRVAFTLCAFAVLYVLFTQGNEKHCHGQTRKRSKRSHQMGRGSLASDPPSAPE